MAVRFSGGGFHTIKDIKKYLARNKKWKSLLLFLFA